MADQLPGLNLVGLNQALRAFRKFGDGAAREMRNELRGGIATRFAGDVKKKVESRGLVKSGRLEGTIKPSVRGSQVFVTSRPVLNAGQKSPQGYAPIYEFGHGGARAFMEPTRQEWMDSGKLESELTEYLEWIEREWRA